MSEEEVRNDAVLLERQGDLAVIRLGPSDEKLSVLSLARMDSLTAAVAGLRKADSPKGLIITGAQGNAFCAGADVKLIRDLKDGSVARQLAQQGQEAFNAIEALPFPTLAAISGVCVGGGCELALACDYRLMADTAVSSIGLPEVKLGIIPGFGGTQRLPRLVGLRPALDIILKGKRISTRQAAGIGLVDKVVAFENDEAPPAEVEAELMKHAVAFFENLPAKKSPPMQEKVMMSFPPARAYAESAARKAVAKQTQGLYPAPPMALDAVFTGLKSGVEAGLGVEADAIGKLLVGKVCKSLVYVFNLTEEASKLGRGASELIEGKKVSVLGGGVMGSGIATSFLATGDEVVVVETSDAAKRKAHSAISSNIEGRRSWSAGKKKRLLSNLQVTVDLAKAESSAVVIEAVIEDLETKAKLLRSASQHISETAILATNTSSLSVSALAEKINNPSRVVGMHFFNPADRMPLVEVVVGNQSSDKSVAVAAAIAGHLGKFPVVVRDVPGFLVNRIFAPYMVEAAYLLSAGYGIENIDNAARNFGLPMGPIRLLDEVGLDVASKVAQIMDSSYGVRMRGPKHVDELARNGLLGKKSGAGFYIHTDKKPVVNPEAEKILERSIASRKHGMSKGDIEKRLVMPMINEAVRCFDEAVAGKPSPQAAGQIDLASVMGMGFPACYGGLMRYAESLGAKHIHEQLEKYKDKFGERYEPALGIVKRAADGISFYQSI